jgi:hypothetical protein
MSLDISRAYHSQPPITPFLVSWVLSIACATTTWAVPLKYNLHRDLEVGRAVRELVRREFAFAFLLWCGSVYGEGRRWGGLRLGNPAVSSIEIRIERMIPRDVLSVTGSGQSMRNRVEGSSTFGDDFKFD